ncbi:NAD(P)-binding domain-containing protein [Brevibacterium sp. RIT 803]|uniref:NmrA family NAD(P)-binding protein n=1 Tax=Brevibacterium sp. RIT 803 TaxID=2810210 RepID=UPI001951A73B|nr:NAD(P)-binding domain-containing protein [Brevibacterium sp. RIT 803]MBM6588486.1 NAD(P)-binding domain-containing protein [Brevibacterium sp. RIT 803]
MKSALVIGYGQIGSEIASQLTTAGIHVAVATRSAPAAVAVTAAAGQGSTAPAYADHANGTDRTNRANGATIARVQADASDPEQLLEAAAGSDVIFACVHAPYDSRVWAQVLPHLDKTIMDAAAELGIPVIFPESVYAFAGTPGPVTESSPFAPVEEKGRIRQQLMEARLEHPATSASVVAGDLLGTTAQPQTSVVRMCITAPISKGRRAIVPARSDVAHGITVIEDLAAAMIGAAQLLEDVPAGTHRLLIAPSSNPTLGEIAEFTHEHLGTRPRRPLSLPRWTTRAAGIFERSMHELNRLAPIWYSPCVIEPGPFAEDLGTTDWREGVRQML